MREVLRLNKKEENDKPVEFLEFWDNIARKWVKSKSKPSSWDNVLYRETIKGLDYFVCWANGDFTVFNYRGHLNSEKF